MSKARSITPAQEAYGLFLKCPCVSFFARACDGRQGGAMGGGGGVCHDVAFSGGDDGVAYMFFIKSEALWLPECGSVGG